MAKKSTTTRGGRSPTLKWTHTMRTALHLISTEFDLGGQQRTNLFNQVFAAELTASGLPQGTRSSVLTAQHNMRKSPEKAKGWIVVCAPPATQEEVQLREGLRGRIRGALNGDGAPVASSSNPGRANGSSPSQEQEQDNNMVMASTQMPLSQSSSAGSAAARRPRATAPVTPVSLRKRTIAQVIEQDDTDSSGEYTPSQAKRARMTARSKKIVALSTLVYRPGEVSAVPRPVLNKTVPQTPRGVQPKKSSTRHAEKVPYQVADGDIIMVSERLSRTLGQPLEPVPQHLARPPCPDLLLRYYEERTPRDHNSEDGFIARKYFLGLPPTPPPTHLDPQDILDHMDRRKVPTPFISTCNKLIWIVQLAIKEAKKGVENGRIALIDPIVVGERSVFWAPPHQREVAHKTALFKNGAWHYHGNYEYLVWGAIPREAIVATVKVADLLNLPRSYPDVARVLRYDILKSSAALTTKDASLRQQQIPLESAAAKAIARLASCLGLSAHSAVHILSHVVADVVRGWRLVAVFRSPQSWRDLAEKFARILSKGEEADWVSPRQYQNLKLAFLDGVRWSQGEFNARHKPETMAQMQKKARLIGLESPSHIIADELDEWKISLFSVDTRVEKLSQGRQSAALLLQAPRSPAVEEADDDHDELQQGQDVLEDWHPIAGPSRPRGRVSRRPNLQLEYETQDNEVLFE